MSSSSLNIHQGMDDDIKVNVGYNNWGSRVEIEVGDSSVCIFTKSKTSLELAFNPLNWEVNDNREYEEINKEKEDSNG